VTSRFEIEFYHLLEKVSASHTTYSQGFTTMKKTIISLGFVYVISNIANPTGALLYAAETCYDKTVTVKCVNPVGAAQCEEVKVKDPKVTAGSPSTASKSFKLGEKFCGSRKMTVGGTVMI
jgi:hypothetical protein